MKIERTCDRKHRKQNCSQTNHLRTKFNLVITCNFNEIAHEFFNIASVLVLITTEKKTITANPKTTFCAPTFRFSIEMTRDNAHCNYSVFPVPL